VAVGAGEYEIGILGDRPRMARQMAEAIEWVVFAYQGVSLLQTALINPFPPAYRSAVLALAAIHFGFAVFVLRNRGLILRNQSWILAWVLSAAAIPVVLALMLPHKLYGTNDSCVTACTYPAPVVLIISLYPWIFGAFILRKLVAPGLIVVLLAEWLALISLLGDKFTLTAVQSILVSVMWVAAAYGIGWALRRIVEVWLRERNEVEQQSAENFVNFLHSHIKAGLAAVERESPNIRGMLEKLHDLQVVVSEKRLSLLLSKDQIPLAVVCSERIRVFSGQVRIAETPRIGARTSSQPVGQLIDRALGDLLSNAVAHGAETVWIRFAPRSDELVLEVLDDGPGFEDRVLDDPGKALHRLRQAARELGGDLNRYSGEPNGSKMVLNVPQ
jgi:signal transduction histidine kinase